MVRKEEHKANAGTKMVGISRTSVRVKGRELKRGNIQGR
jgi:hypothetical protein